MRERRLHLAASARAVRGPPGPAGEPLLVRELAPCSERLVAPGSALWEGPAREQPQAGGAEEASQPPGRGGGGKGPPGAGRGRVGTRRCRGGLGAGRRSLLEYGRIQGLAREMESVRAAAGAAKTPRDLCGVCAGGGGGGQGCAGPPGGDNGTGRLRWGCVPPGPAPAAPPRPRDSPVPLSRRDPVPPPAQGGPGPAGPGIDVRQLGLTVGLALPPGAAPGAAAPVPGALPVVQPPWPERAPGHPHRGAPLCPERSGSAAVAMATDQLWRLSRCHGNRSRCHPCHDSLRGFSSSLGPPGCRGVMRLWAINHGQGSVGQLCGAGPRWEVRP